MIASRPTVHERTPRESAPVLRRCACSGKCSAEGECEACRRKRLRRKPFAQAPSVAPPSVHAVLASPGRPLETGVRTLMEARLGHDLGRVRIHADTLAAQSATEVGALAWTVAQHVAFGPGRYRPGTSDGDRLLTHELAHTLQNSHGRVGGDIPIGSVNDAAEREADRLANTSRANGPGAVPARPAALRRTPDSAPPRETMAVIPVSDGPPAVHMDVRRRFERCPCRNVPEARDGLFYDVARDRVAIAYRYCRGRTTTDVYGEAEGDPERVLRGELPITGARIGVEINVAPRRGESGRIILEGVGERGDDESAVGAHVLLVYDGRGWRIFAEADYRRRLGELNDGRVPDDVDISLGGEWGRVRARVVLSDLASGARGARLETCVDLGIGADLCGFGEIGGERGPTGGIGIRVPFGTPAPAREEYCRQCYCPPARPVYECQRYTFPWIEDRPVTIDVTEEHEFRYYFHLDRDTPAEDPALVAQSNANLDALERRVRSDEATILDIAGYTSPEATERHNESLSESRGRRLHDLIAARLGRSVTVPTSRGAGELLGRRPAPVASSRLGDIISEHGFRRAEDLTVFLLGEEIPNRELTEQFLSLFDALTEPADRLAVFGLSDSDAIAPRVLTAVDRFIASRGRGPRPWERVFRLLRVAVARVAWTESRATTEEVRHGPRREPVTGTDCERYARRAESERRFPRIEPRDLIPRVDRSERNAECEERPTGDEPAGCDYTVPPALRSRTPLTAPARAPRRF